MLNTDDTSFRDELRRRVRIVHFKPLRLHIVAALLAASAPVSALAQENWAHELEAIGAPPRLNADCPIGWAREFNLPGVATSGVTDMLAYDDGSGMALYVAGISAAGDLPLRHVAKWDGQNWHPIGTGLGFLSDDTITVNALAVFDDGVQTALYVGGSFNSDYGWSVAPRAFVARWDGSVWSLLATGPQSSRVDVLCAFEDGPGRRLYVGGRFAELAGVSAANVIRFDGADWAPLGSGISGDSTWVEALAVWDDGNGAALYAGGRFEYVDGELFNHLAKWNGTTWEPVGGGVTGGGYSGPIVHALATFGVGADRELYVGGAFESAGDVTVNSVARWNGQDWAPLGIGVTGANGPGTIYDLFADEEASTPALWLAGDFKSAGAAPGRIVKWDGSQMIPVGGIPTGTVTAVRRCTLGSVASVFAGGTFSTAGDVPVANIARWTDASWMPLGTGNGLQGSVLSAAVHDDGAGPALYAGGKFRVPGEPASVYVARWDGSAWYPLTEINFGDVWSLASFDDGSGPALFIGTGAVLIWRDGILVAPEITIVGDIYTLAVLDDGTGPALYAGGDFEWYPDNSQRAHVARWDGVEWRALATISPSTTNRRVNALAMYDSGEGPRLYAGGKFDTAEGNRASLAVWTGEHWSPVLSETEWPYHAPITALTVFDDGTGAKLYLGVDMSSSGGSGSALAAWDGADLRRIDGLDAYGWKIHSLLSVVDPLGPALYVGGDYFRVNGDRRALARWDGKTWSPLGLGFRSGGFSMALAAWPSADFAEYIYAAGSFGGAAGRMSSGIARWGCLPDFTLGDLNCDGAADAADVEPFVLAILDARRYLDTYPACEIATADCNRDGRLDLFDIDPFVALLSK